MSNNDSERRGRGLRVRSGKSKKCTFYLLSDGSVNARKAWVMIDEFLAFGLK
jgi:hypothetical protein